MLPGGLTKDQLPDLSEEEIDNRNAALAKLDAARGNLEDAYSNWATLTAAERNDALRLAIRIICGLSRIVVHRYDSPGP
jgi:hypothetical protein